jgi:hypothetical protein
MIRKAGPQPDGRRAESLTSPARQVHQAAPAALAQTGQSPTRSELEQLDRSLGASPDAVLAELAGAGALGIGIAEFGTLLRAAPRPGAPATATPE